MELKRVGVLSCGKVLGLLYAAMGLIFGGIFSLISIGGMVASAGQGAAAGMLFGVGAIVFLPIFYGVLGFISGLVLALLYNLLAQFVGGLELELESRDS